MMNNQINIKDEYYTPKWLFDNLALKFDLDPCSPGKYKSNSPATVHYSFPQNGLELPWRGRVFMNPPYSKPTLWVDKFIENNNGVALLLFSKAAWLQKLWNASDAITLLPPNLKFEHQGKEAQIQFQCALFAIGDECVSAIQRLKISRVR
jgi:hypothetical protein